MCSEEMDYTLDDAQENDDNASSEQPRADTAAAGYTQAERNAIGGLLFLTGGADTDDGVIDEAMRRHRAATPAPAAERAPTAG